MNCERLQQGWLVEYLTGALDDGMRREVERHLASCPSCKAEADTMGAAVPALQAGLAARRNLSPRLDTARRREILKTVRGKRVEVIQASSWWVRYQPLLNVAAILILTLTCVGLFMPAMSMSHGRAKQASISAARARDAQVRLGLDLSQAEGMAAKDRPPVMMALACKRSGAARGGSGEVAEESDTIALEPSDRSKVSHEGWNVGGVLLDGVVVNGERRRVEIEKRADAIVPAATPPADGSYLSGTPAKPAEEPMQRSALRYGHDGNGRQNEAEREVARGEMKKAEDLAPSTPLVMSGLYSSRSEGGRKSALARYGGGNAKDDGKSGAVQRPDITKLAGSDDLEVAADAPGLTVQKALKEDSADLIKALEETSVKAGSLSRGAGPESGKQAQQLAQQEQPAATAMSEATAAPQKPAQQAQQKAIQAQQQAQEPVREDQQQAYAKDVPGVGSGDGRRGRRDEKREADDKKIEEPAPVYGQEIEAAKNPFSTFSIDVDTASFTRSRQFLLSGKLPSPGAVRVEEFVNAFEYGYPSPERKAFAVYADRARSPFRSQYETLRIGVRGKVIGRDRQKRSVLTLVIDASGSMNAPDRLDLVKASLRLLLDNMAPNDRIAIITFGSEARLALDATPVSKKAEILKVLDSLQTSGSTQLEGGIKLGYETAARHFASGALNRVLILSDGVANLGAGTASEILAQVESYRRQGIYCSVFGFGSGPYNDAMLETLADKGDGVYRFVDSPAEARRVFVDDLAANLHVIARDVKIQVEFDPRRVKTYRQLGYENRALTKEQFRDDTVDAGEVGSGQSVTALYEIRVQGNALDPLGMVRVRWMDPETGKVEELERPLLASEGHASFDAAPARFRLAAGVAEFADHLRRHPLAAGTEMGEVERVIRAVSMELPLDRRVADLVQMVTAARNMIK